METRSRLAEIFKDRIDYSRYHEQLRRSSRSTGMLATTGPTAAATLHPVRRWCLRNRHLKASPTSSWCSRSRRALLKSRREWTGRSETGSARGLRGCGRHGGSDLLYRRGLRRIQSRTARIRAPRRLSARPKRSTTRWSSRKRHIPSKSRRSTFTTKNHELLASGIYNPWVQKSLESPGDPDARALCEERVQRGIRQLDFVLRLQDADRARPGGR